MLHFFGAWTILFVSFFFIVGGVKLIMMQLTNWKYVCKKKKRVIAKIKEVKQTDDGEMRGEISSYIYKYYKYK